MPEKFSKEPQFVETGLKSPITELAFSLAAYKDGKWRASGTAVSIASRFLITAKHVIQDYWKHFGDGSKLRGSITGEFGIIARQMLNGGSQMSIWQVRRMWLSPNTDIAFLKVDPITEYAKNYKKWRVPQLQLSPPNIGERVSAFGYHTPDINFKQEGNKIEVRWDDHPSTSVGEVESVFEHRRDNSFMNFPCFQTNARFEGGMSGGPIFNDSGKVCGLVCSSLVGSSLEGFTSYGTVLWPSMSTYVHFTPDGKFSDVPHRLLDLANSGVINTTDNEKLEIIRAKDDSIIRFNKDKN